MLIGLDEFANGDPEALYARMRPDQRTAVANEFVRALVLSGDPRADDFRYAGADRYSASGEDYAPPEESSQAQAIVPHLLSPAEAARVHRYTREHHPDLFEKVAHHPVTQAALAFPGAIPEPEPPAPQPIWEESAAIPLIAGAAREDVAPEFTPQSVPEPGIELGELEKRDHDAINRAVGGSAGELPA